MLTSRDRRSALTDFLASNNISATQIRDSHERRLADARRATEEENEAANDEDYQPESRPATEPESQPESPEDRTRKRKRQQAIDKIKKSKEFARRKARRAGEPDDDDDALANEMMVEKQRPNPGQLANCETCGKRFTVTAYSKTGPKGGLLCADCSKNQNGEKKKSPAKKKPNAGLGRRQNQSNFLDGKTTRGAQSLLEMCINKVADKIDDVEEFGDLPPMLLHRLSQILSRNRAITPRTLDLFLRPLHRELNIYDCARLNTDDFHKILATMPDLTRLNLRFVTPMKDRVFQYMVDRDMKIQDLHLDGPNLVTDDCWRAFFMRLGPRLQSLKLWNLDTAFDDETMHVMSTSCPGLRRLKLKHIAKIGDRALEAISNLGALEHLSLHLMKQTAPESLLQVIAKVGPNLRSLSLEGFERADDRLLQSIHDNCRNLQKLRLTDNNVFTDKGLRALFQGWTNPALKYVDLHGLRDMDMTNPDGPPEPIGLASDGFKALMAHSGSRLQHLNIESCRHVPWSVYEEVFAESKVYPALKYLDISFTGPVDDFLTQCIFRCCPSLARIVVFGCFRIKHIQVPRDIAVIGRVTANLTAESIAEKNE
ncbi:hypothetical protein N7492_009348 [Penicillium capsulatum]|uniref:DNA repair protein rhp7 treble clef domain-containing protein n=1 Tax=Penicillium capsulatum TaxID=69766 RepID=A0A9W9HUG8_9EURO|nr:hypothetical protein N7492_009348 [Penicillium capsulatum]